MLKLPAICVAALLAVQAPLASAGAASAPELPPIACTSPAQKVDEKGFVSIGGIEQWVTVKGDSCANPIILFLSGGPGNPLSPYSDAIFGAWTRDFTLLGVHMAMAKPELFYAYLGTAQVVNNRENEAASYAKLIGLVRSANDTASLAVLESVGAPPWTDPRSFGKVRRVIRQYEAKVTTPAPKAWWAPAPENTPRPRRKPTMRPARSIRS